MGGLHGVAPDSCAARLGLLGDAGFPTGAIGCDVGAQQRKPRAIVVENNRSATEVDNDPLIQAEDAPKPSIRCCVLV